MRDDRQRKRATKRDVKRAGNRDRRRTLKRSLARDPENAAFDRFTFKRECRSELLNEPSPDRARPRRVRPVREEEEE